MGHAHAYTRREYARRRPEETDLYKIVQRHLATFLAEQEMTGTPLPEYVIKELNAFLDCGILSNGFLRLRCEECHAESIVGFSCKKRGFCPACCGRRMNEAAAHLTENVLPHLPYRQFVITLPIPLRHWVAKNHRLLGDIHRQIISAITDHYLDLAADLGLDDATIGTVSFNQRWGSAANLNPHFHILVTDGVYHGRSEDAQFRPMTGMVHDDVDVILEDIIEGVVGLLRKRGYLDSDDEIACAPPQDDIFVDHPNLQQITDASIAGRVAFGPDAFLKPRAIGRGFGYEGEDAERTGRLCSKANGFSLHANTKTNTLDREGLERLIRYMARGPLSNDRVRITSDDRVRLKLKTPWQDGTEAIDLTFSAFLERLVALIPPPGGCLVRWGGVFASASPRRSHVVQKSEKKKGFGAESDNSGVVRFTWSKLLARTFKIDVEHCTGCGGSMRILGAITDPFEARRYLQHVEEACEPPARSPPKVQCLPLVEEDLGYPGTCYDDYL